MRAVRSTVILLALSGGVRAETITLPAAASVVGLAPFYSDVRAFNTSYTAMLTVTAQYRCFIGTCGAAPQTFTLGPRESRAFDDVCVSLFTSPGSAGAIELSHGGADGTLVVTSRLYSTAPTPTVGMFVPGLPLSTAQPVTVLTSIRNGGPGAGFRANVGVYNPGDAAATPRFKVYDGGTLVGTATLPAPLSPHAGAQLNDVFGAIGAGSVATANAWIVIDSGGTQGLFSYAAVIDNATTDPIFVVGAPDQAPPAGPQEIVISVKAWNFSPGGPVSQPLRLTVGTTYRLVFHNVDVPGTPNARHGFSGLSDLGLPEANDISAGHDFVIESFMPQAFQRGSYP
ncbi:MAG: hypothetical protein WAU32_01155, partial [Thermoanaerobaculia bacterium]